MDGEEFQPFQVLSSLLCVSRDSEAFKEQEQKVPKELLDVGEPAGLTQCPPERPTHRDRDFRNLQGSHTHPKRLSLTVFSEVPLQP